MTGSHWRDGNQVKLLENGEEFYPRVFDAFAKAQKEILIETFIVFEDKVGTQLRDTLAAAARRGVAVTLVVDGYGTADLSAEFAKPMVDAGVKLRMFDPRPRIMGLRTNLFRRLHRKLIVVDRKLGFVGGLNFSDDHLLDFGPTAKQDYAVEVAGPIVDDIYATMTDTPTPPPTVSNPRNTSGKDVRAILATRDNRRHRADIEWHYREAMRTAEREILIANAYFFPGYRFVRALRDAARRGVDVTLILQGRPDQPLARWASTTLYDWLLRNGVSIHEYCRRPMHSKVAVIDGEWATVGSSNLDPLSLFLNLEANVIVRNRDFAAVLRKRLVETMQEDCKELSKADAPPRTLPRQVLSWLVFHLIRRFPAWVGLLPAHTPKKAPLPALSEAAATFPKEKEAA